MLEEPPGMADPLEQHEAALAAPAAAAGGDDGDGVWTRDIEEAFEEALAIYPPCGRRKIILTDEGKMYGRNELIARYIKMRTGKTRSRKQVSSHIQVLARKKQREFASKVKVMAPGGTAKSGYAGLSSAEIVSQSIVRERSGSMPGAGGMLQGQAMRSAYTAAMGPGSGSLRLALHHFSGYLEFPMGGRHTFAAHNGSASFVNPNIETIDLMQIHDKFPGIRDLYAAGPRNAFFLSKFWVDMHFDVLSEQIGDSNMAMDMIFESFERHTITVESEIVSLGKQVVRVSTDLEPEGMEPPFSYKHERSQLCHYLVSFINKLRLQESAEHMNRVLENFSAIVTVKSRSTQEILFYSAFVFEVTPAGYGPRCLNYSLVDSQADSMVDRRFTA